MSVELHHLAAISSDLQRTIGFYSNILGLQFLLKQSLFDGPQVCHFYWENDLSNFITFFHCPCLRRGEVGFNSVCSISFSVSRRALNFWQKRLQLFGIHFSRSVDELDNTYALVFHDPDGLQLKLVFNIDDYRCGNAKGDINGKSAIKGFFGIEILVPVVTNLKRFFVEQCSLDIQPWFANSCRLSSLQKPGTKIDLITNASKTIPLSGCGSVHHIALKVPSWKHFMGLHYYLQGQKQTIISRAHEKQYSTFYFKEEGGLLIEIVWQRPFVSCNQTKCKNEVAFST